MTICARCAATVQGADVGVYVIAHPDGPKDACSPGCGASLQPCDVETWQAIREMGAV